MGNLTTVKQLETILKITLADDDPYALLMIAQASGAVVDAAMTLSRSATAPPLWVYDTPETPAVAPAISAPPTVRDITLWVAQRAFTNPRNLAQRSSGPVTERYFENGVFGLELTDSEKERLGNVLGTSSSGGLWVQPIDAGTRSRLPF